MEFPVTITGQTRDEHVAYLEEMQTVDPEALAAHFDAVGMELLTYMPDGKARELGSRIVAAAADMPLGRRYDALHMLYARTVEFERDVTGDQRIKLLGIMDSMADMTEAMAGRLALAV